MSTLWLSSNGSQYTRKIPRTYKVVVLTRCLRKIIESGKSVVGEIRTGNIYLRVCEEQEIYHKSDTIWPSQDISTNY